MNWYNWYYNVTPKTEEPVIIPSVEKTPHDFPSCNFSQANEAIIAPHNDPPPPHKANKKKKKKNKK
jgi:hypothetical protein